MSEETKKTISKKYYDNVNVGKRTKQVVYLTNEQEKPAMLAKFLQNRDKTQTVIVAKSKRRADELSAFLKTKEIVATPIHGNHRVTQIEEVTAAFNDAALNIIIITDMILQSLDLKAIQSIISYDLSLNHEDYFSRLILVDEVGESILFVSPEEKVILNIIEIKLKDEIHKEKLQDFTPENTEVFIHSLKEKTKKPRHQKKKRKTKVKKETF
jgi:ATP-dependent RNA helicase RhlE